MDLEFKKEFEEVVTYLEKLPSNKGMLSVDVNSTHFIIIVKILNSFYHFREKHFELLA